MTVDEVRAEYAELMRIPLTKDRDGEFAGRAEALQYGVLEEIAHNPNADARALARAAIGADDETS